MWTACFVSHKAHREHRRLSDFVIAELATWSNPIARRVLSSHAQEFMRNGLKENMALVAAYTLCVDYSGAVN